MLIVWKVEYGGEMGGGVAYVATLYAENTPPHPSLCSVSFAMENFDSSYGLL